MPLSAALQISSIKLEDRDSVMSGEQARASTPGDPEGSFKGLEGEMDQEMDMDEEKDQDVLPEGQFNQDSKKTISGQSQNPEGEPKDEEYEAVAEDLKQTTMSREQKLAFQKSMTSWDDKLNSMISQKDRDLEDRLPQGKKKWNIQINKLYRLFNMNFQF